MARVRIDNSIGTLGAALTSAGTTITFASAPSWATLPKGNIIPLVLDPPGASPNGNYEVVYVTAYTSGATTATIKRGQEGTTGVAHSNGATWMVGPTAAGEGWDNGSFPLVYTSDFTDATSMASSGAPLVNGTGNATIDTTNQQIKNTDGSENRIFLQTSYLGYSQWRGGIVQAKYVPSSTTPDFSLTMDDANTWLQFTGGNMVFKNFTGGTFANGTVSIGNLTVGSTYWVRFYLHWPMHAAEIWTKDPTTAVAGDVPVATTSFYAGGGVTSFKPTVGRPGIRMNTNGDLVKELKFWRIPIWSIAP